MPVLKEFEALASVTLGQWIYVGMGRTYCLLATGLGAGETVSIHVQSAVGTEQLYVDGEAIQLTSTHMITPIHGPCRIKPVKSVTAGPVRVELFTEQING